MKIDRIQYQRVFAIGNYVTERIGLEASLDPNDNPQTELEHLKIVVNELHSATIATLEEFRGTKVRDVVEEQSGNSKQDEAIAQLYVAVEKKLNKFKFREEAQAYLDTTEFKVYVPARQIVNSLPLKNK